MAYWGNYADDRFLEGDIAGWAKGAGAWLLQVPQLPGALILGDMWNTGNKISADIQRHNYAEAAVGTGEVVLLAAMGGAAKGPSTAAGAAAEVSVMETRVASNAGKTVLGKFPEYINLADELARKTFQYPYGGLEQNDCCRAVGCKS